MNTKGSEVFKFSGEKRTISNKKILSVLLLIVLLLQAFIGCVQAVDYSRTTGSLEITRYGTYTDSTGTDAKKVISGVTFNIYKVDSDTTSTTEPSEQPVQSLVTGEDGKVKFENLPLGRYLVVEKNAPANVKGKVENFLVDIPTTNEAGTGLIYDVTVSPKTETSYGSVTLIKKNQNNEALEGVKFLLQKQEGTAWVNYPSNEQATLATNAEGKIVVDGFSEGDYRFVETDLGSNVGYILDNKTGYEFSVSFDDNKNAVVTPDTINVVNEKLTISKAIEKVTKGDNDTNNIVRNLKSADKGDTISYKISVDVPTKIAELNTYKISDTMNENLIFNESSIKVYGINRETSAQTEITDYTLAKTTNGFELTFTNANLADYSKLEIVYDVKLSETASELQTGYNNEAKLTYSTIVKKAYNGTANTDSTAENAGNVLVYTGGFKILKRANNNNGKLLSGAEFKLATSVANAEKGEFIKDANGDEIVLTTDQAGSASYYGLAFGEYQLVETKAPVDENGKSYNLLERPQVITIDETTYSSDITVINKSGTILPSTGGTGAIVFIVIGVSALGAMFILRKKNSKH